MVPVLLGTLAACLLALATGCGDGTVEPTAPPTPVPTTVTISPASATLQSLGETTQLTAEVHDQNGQAMANTTVAWTSSDPSVATVAASGLATAVANGTATVTATAGTVSASATVTVAQEVSAVSVAPADAEVLERDTLRLYAEATDANGHLVAGVTFSWASGDTLVASVDHSGLVTGIGVGQVQVTAASSDVVGRAEVLVVAPVPSTVAVTPDSAAFTALGDTVRFTTEVLDQIGRVMVTEVTWTSSDAIVVAVDSSGLAMAVGNGTASVTATAGAASASAMVSVAQRVSAVAVDAVADMLVQGDTLRLTPQATDANGHLVADAEFSWASSDTAVASVDPSGLVTGIAAGQVDVIATSSGVVGRMALVVVAPAPTMVVVTPPSAVLTALSDTVRFMAEVLDQIGRPMTGVPRIWASNDPMVATIDSAGLAMAVANGTATVTATAGTATATATVEVAQAASIVTLAPATATLASGDTVRIAAAAADANGHAIAGATFEWSSSAPVVAEVDHSGLVRGLSGGTARITANAGSASATATVRIVQTIATLDVAPASLTPAQAGKQGRDTIVVTVADAVGNPIAGASYTWTTDRHSGWVWPARGRTGADGRIVATWVAGWPGNGILSLKVTKASSRMTTEIRTRSTGSRNNPSGAVTIWTNTRGETATAYSIDMTPLAEPPGTYYAAIQWDGGYTGLQRGGSHYDRQLQFSVWDAPGVGGAEVVERGEGVRCYTFGGEGTGQACNLNYPWSVGSTYRFEVTERELNGGSAMTLHVTDLASGTRRFVGTLRFARRARMNGFGMFVEDFWMRGEHCLAREVRSAAIRRAMARINGAWTPLTKGYLSRHPHDYFNLGTPPCANLAARPHAAGLEIVIGGETASDPNSSPWYTIPR